MRTPGFSDDNSIDVNVISRPGSDFAPPTNALQSIGPQAIANKMRGQIAEFPLSGLPKTFEIFNRAKLGNVKYWAQAFDSVMYPEDATEDRTTWLGPGEKATLPLDAVLHFFGNIFHPTFEGAKAVIEACGGFLLEPRAEQHPDAKNIPPARIIGGPLFLPDFIITGYSGRAKIAFGPFSLYEAYDKLTRRLQKAPVLQNEGLKAQEAALLADRLEEYRSADVGLFDQYGQPITRSEQAEPEPCDCFPIAHAKGVPGCRAGDMLRKKRGRKPIEDADELEDGVEQTLETV